MRIFFELTPPNCHVKWRHVRQNDPTASIEELLSVRPAGTGKSTWVRSVFKDAIYLNLLESELYRLLLASPQRLETLIPPGYHGWVVLDEIQRVPELLNEVHRLIETRGLLFVLTGSSARKLRRKGTNLLAGRALTRRMHPLTAMELGSDFRLEHALKLGHMPMTFSDPDPDAYLSSYVHSYLREEVQQEGLTRNLQAFARFLEVVSFSQASPLNISEAARECDVNRKLAEEYFTILEDLLLAVRLPPFENGRRDGWRPIRSSFFSMPACTGPSAPKGFWTGRRRSTARPWKPLSFRNCGPSMTISIWIRSLLLAHREPGGGGLCPLR